MANIGVLVGSLSQKAYSQKVANYLMALPVKAHFVQLNYDILPLYNPDLEKQVPLEWQVFREVADKMDALLLVTPEYNFSIPGGLKNAIDVLSVPSPRPHLFQKPAMVVTASSGARGGANANARIQQLLRYTGMDVMNSFITVGHVQQIFDRDNRLTDQDTAHTLDDAMGQFVEMVNHHASR